MMKKIDKQIETIIGGVFIELIYGRSLHINIQ